AAEQSYRLTIPQINYLSNSKAICDIINQYDYVLVAYEEQAKHNENSHFKHIPIHFPIYKQSTQHSITPPQFILPTTLQHRKTKINSCDNINQKAALIP
ncbi:CamS family sex pheromone protein, partial [Staphylococcus epidermidis]|uniref:CamS family sex pheromone protein n=1 Tax=Staphylococcus epidermidis TaxID=1282 RepID=UPI001643492A